MKKSVLLNGLLLIPGILLLPGCSWFSKGDECPACASVEHEGEAVATINGRKAVTLKDLKATLDAVEQQQPGFMSLDPEQLKMFLTQIVESMVQVKLVKAHLEELGETKTAEFKKEVAQAFEQIENQIAIKKIQEMILKGIKVDDTVAKETYEKNRETSPYYQRPPFMTKMKGVETVLVKVGSDKEASALLDRARKLNDLKKAATELKKQAQNLGVVTGSSRSVDYRVIQVLMGMSKFPEFAMTPGIDGKSFFVVQGLKQHPGEFAKYEDVKDQVKQMVQGELFGKEFEALLKTLKEKNKVEVNATLLATLLPAPKAPAQAAQEPAAAPAAA